MNIDQKYIHPGSHEENGQVERTNKEMSRHLIMVANEMNDKKVWVDYLPIVQRILNSTEFEKLGSTPAQLLFGSNVNLDRHFLTTPKPANVEKVSQWLDNFLREPEKQIDDARAYENKRIDKQIKKGLKRPFDEITEYEVNDRILVDWPANGMTGKQDKPNRLNTSRRGPFIVVKKHKNNTYDCVQVATKSQETFSVYEMHPYLSNMDDIDEERVARTDSDLIMVTAILKHRFYPAKHKIMKNLQLQVKFNDAKKPVWQQYTNGFEKVAIVHEYLRKHKLDYLITKEFREIQDITKANSKVKKSK